MVDNMEQQIYDFIRPYAGIYLFNIKKVILTPDTDLDTDLSIDEYEIDDLMNEYFAKFNVDKGNYCTETYYPDVYISWNPFKKVIPVQVPDFTIGMLIESAKAGKWLYD
ncbi:DUF1493 family protein [Rahnella bonaserana]|uniref:DUF1493 family protein n=1 Tax=Rahnella bonaserana TaxID=2816248 RepID=A0ABS6LTU4_9GAMM|nr:DUF1493 family protein [Rahnella bonaserana]MBU9855525.1 DUF1493 family protein [Rahnella bonaserana]